MKLHCPSQHRIPLGKSSPLPFISNLLCFLFPEFAFWSFWIWTKPKSQLKSHSTLAASAVVLVCTRRNHMWHVWFQARYQPGFTCKPFNRVKLTVVTSLWILPELLSIFWALCCFVGSLLSSRLFPWINTAGWHTELPIVSWYSMGITLWIRKLNILILIRERLPGYI